METAVTVTESRSTPRALDVLANMQRQAIERFELELNDMRAAMTAMAACCEQPLARLRDARWVSFEAASQLVTDLSAAADFERARAASLADDLEAARRELEKVRAECRTEVEAARDAAVRYRNETAASWLRELNAARERAQSAIEAEARVREELTAMQTRNQEIADAQMLRLAELNRELERARGAADRANNAAPPKPGPEGRAAEAPAQPAPNRNHLAPEFAAIEAVLAGNPPLAARWERIA